MESMTSFQSSDSDTSLTNTGLPHYDYRHSGSTSSLLNLTTKNICPTNVLKFSELFHQILTFIGLRRTHFPGSATATICVLNNRDLSALNLGDSGFILIRFDTLSGEPYILIKSNEQTHGFNTPY